MSSIDEKFARKLVLALRQTEIIRAQVDVLYAGLSDVSRDVGVQMINAAPPSPPPPAAPEVSKTEKVSSRPPRG